MIAIDHVYSRNDEHEVSMDEQDEEMQPIHDETILNLFPELA